MGKNFYWGVIAIVLSCWACNKTAENILFNIPSSDLIRLVVNMDQLRIYEAPGLETAEMGIISMGAEVPYAGSMTDFTTKLKLGGVWYDEPWISILTMEGDTGWVYGGGVIFEGDDSEELSELLLEKRMKAFFGNLSSAVLDYRDDYANASTSEAFANVFHDGEELRERMVSALEEKIPATEVENLPNIFWIEDIFPGYVVELVAEGTQYYLFKDFRQLHQKALQTEGEEDDVFTDLGLTIYQRDSIEYFYPSWFMQTWDYGGHSLLGSGKHNDVLAHADEVMQMSNFFKDDVSVFKKEVMRDISDPSITYWNSQENIITEIDEIIQMEYEIINRDDIVLLKSRKQQFEDYEANGIELNVRIGEEI